MDNQNVLSPHELGGHEIVKYQFKKVNATTNTIIDTDSLSKDNQAPLNKESIENIEQKESASSIIKPDDMDKFSDFQTNMMDKFENLTQKLQDVQETFSGSNTSQSSQEELQQRYQDGFDAGKKEAMESNSSANNEIQERFTQSISSITNYVDKANNTISSLESELVRASIDIAQEIIQIQIEEKSNQVALEISKNLLSNLSEATKITLKVSVFDYDHIINNLQDDRITIEKDLAIAKGGVMIFSDVMNIDGTIKERFAKIKSAFYEENQK